LHNFMSIQPKIWSKIWRESSRKGMCRTVARESSSQWLYHGCFQGDTKNGLWFCVEVCPTIPFCVMALSFLIMVVVWGKPFY
jgi:hypothetical protein